MISITQQINEESIKKEFRRQNKKNAGKAVGAAALTIGGGLVTFFAAQERGGEGVALAAGAVAAAAGVATAVSSYRAVKAKHGQENMIAHEEQERSNEYVDRCLCAAKKELKEAGDGEERKNALQKLSSMSYIMYKKNGDRREPGEVRNLLKKDMGRKKFDELMDGCLADLEKVDEKKLKDISKEELEKSREEDKKIAKAYHEKIEKEEQEVEKNREQEPKKDEEGNTLSQEEITDKDGKKKKVTMHMGPRGGRFYYPDGAPKDEDHKVYVDKSGKVKESMCDLASYLKESMEENVNEGLIKNAASLLTLVKMGSKEVLDGILNMYDYICNDDDIDLFLRDFPLKQRMLWKNLYDLYQDQMWSIIDITPESKETLLTKLHIKDPEVETSLADELGLVNNNFTKITPDFRRVFRQIVQSSKNQKLDIQAGQVDSVMLIHDDLLESDYIITINRKSGIKGAIFSALDKKTLEKIFSRIGEDIESGRI